MDLPAFALVDGFRHACRAVDLAPLGMVVERARAFAEREMPLTTPFEIHLAGAHPFMTESSRSSLVRARGRAVWAKDRLVGVKFIDIRDIDRLTIAELLDHERRLGHALH